MSAQLRDGPWTATSSTTKTYKRIADACIAGLEWSGWLIVLLTLAACFNGAAARLLERLLVP
jgi:hypothetical protein